MCVLVNVAAKHLHEEFTGALDAFVRSGKGLFISTGNQVVAADYNATFGSLLPAPLLDTGPLLAPKDDLFAPDLSTIDIYSFLAKLKEQGNHPLTRLAVAYTAAITPVEDPKTAVNKADLGRVLLRFTNGRPMLLSKNVGSGSVMFLTTSVDPSWSDLFKTYAFVPFINGSIAQMVEQSSAAYNLTAGQPLRWAPPEGQKSYSVIRPDGERTYLGRPKDVEGRLRLGAFDTSMAGVYQIVSDDGKETDRLVFNPDTRETENLEPLDDDRIDDQLGFKPVHLVTGFDGSSFSGTERSRNEWTIWALTALLIFALGETLFAWFCGRAW